jgi:hypothetical protein
MKSSLAISSFVTLFYFTYPSELLNFTELAAKIFN